MSGFPWFRYAVASAAIGCTGSSAPSESAGSESTAPTSPSAPPPSSPASPERLPDAGASPGPPAPSQASGPAGLGFTAATRQVSVDADTTVAVDVYVPSTGGPYPLIVLRHGLTRSKENLAGWGQRMASNGFVAVMPDARVSWRDDPEGDAKDMLTVMAWATHDASLVGKVDPARRILGGHSSGGLAALVAASQDPSLSALLLLDTEGDPLGARVAPQVAFPTLGIFGQPNPLCNENGGGVSSFQALAGPRFGLRIRGASHCDAEAPSGPGCEMLCGSVTDQAQELYQRYVMAFLDAYVTCNPASFAQVDVHAQPFDGVDLFSSDNRGTPESNCAK